jgi:sulfur relay (sulfurtransferase) complex TusBCD TusD component (DsrE family)
MAKTLFILNDPPYGTERSYNALRLAGSLSKRDAEDVKVFLIGDAAGCAKKDQKVRRATTTLRGAEASGDVASTKLALASRQGLGREVVALHQAVNAGRRM